MGAPHYLIFQDFIIDMANGTRSETAGGPNGIYLNGGAHHNRFQRLEVKNNTANGIAFSNHNGNSPFNEILNCSLHHNGRGFNAYGAYIFTSDNLMEGNDVHSNGGYGLHVYNNTGPLDVSRNIIRNNSIHDNGTLGGTNYGLVVAWGDRNVVQDNNIWGNRGGILIYTNSSNAQVLNNTVHDNTPLEGILISGATGTVVRGNSVYANGMSIVDLGIGTSLSENRSSP
jgi:parallel beta-helix repeat protein